MHALLRLCHREFIRRYLLHVLPKGFMWVRHYGYLANCVREKRLAQIRQCLVREETMKAADKVEEQPGTVTIRRCPKCHIGQLIRTIRLPRPRLEGG